MIVWARKCLFLKKPLCKSPYNFFMNTLGDPYASVDRITVAMMEAVSMAILIVVASSGVAFLIYFGFALSRDMMSHSISQVRIVKLSPGPNTQKRQLPFRHGMGAIRGQLLSRISQR